MSQHFLGESALTLGQVRAITSLSKSSIYALADFPKRVKISQRRSCWLASEVQAYLERKRSETRSAL